MKSLYTSLLLLLGIFVQQSVQAQESHSLYQNHSFRHFDRYVYQSDKRFHTSVKPYLNHQLNKVVSLDSLYRIPTNRWYVDRLLNTSWIGLEKNDFAFTIDPLINFEQGQDPNMNDNSWINTRGIMVNAQLGKQVQVTTTFRENQASFPDFRSDIVNLSGRRIIPGQGLGKGFGDSAQYTYDYGFAEAQVSYTANEHFNFTFGHGKNFIGDGYRSLMLSDHAFNYPFLRITTDFWNIKYVNIWAQHQDLTQGYPYGREYDKKWASMHYLDWSVTPWLNIGFFEAIIWQHADTSHVRGFDVNYANPVIFFRPTEFSVGSPDNALMGISGKLTLFRNHVFYGQAIIDEFKVSEILSRSGWWGNKWGIQAGYKTFDLFGLEHLDIQSEFNIVRPYMYSHLIRKQNYGHYQASLAHPLGANFWESVSFLRYNKNRIFFEGQLSFGLYGADIDTLNYGGNIYQPYNTRIKRGEKELGHFIGQGEEVAFVNLSVQLAYMINPRSNMNVYVRFAQRAESSNIRSYNRQLITFGIRTSLQNFYYDY